jgi:hypothetical protein
MKNNRRINIVSALCVSLLMAASALMMSAEDPVEYCMVRCNYGTPLNPIWSAWQIWTCPEGYYCQCDCTGQVPIKQCILKK